MSDKLPYQKVYWSDLLADTLELSNAQLGAYVRLLAANWTNGGLPADRRVIGDMTHLQADDFARLWDFMKTKLVELEDGRVSIQRTEKELQKATKVSEAARKAVAKRRENSSRSKNVERKMATEGG